MDINSPDFYASFDASKAVIGVIGHGYVGTAVDEFFKKKYVATTEATGELHPLFEVCIYDKVKEELGSFSTLVSKSDVVFVCVPTPMEKDGACHTSIIESVLAEIQEEARNQGRPLKSFIVVVKSTVYPGFTDEMKARHPGMRLVFSPEFLTEKSSVRDFETTNRVVLGGDEDDTRAVGRFFYEKLSTRVESGDCAILTLRARDAEMAKLLANGLLMTKVLFCNEVYKLCQKMGVNYDDARFVACLDPRIGISHTQVPGPDGMMGAGGHCFPKDINNLRYLCRTNGVSERLLTAVIERNDEVREEKDWEAMKGRAIVEP